MTFAASICYNVSSVQLLYFQADHTEKKAAAHLHITKLSEISIRYLRKRPFYAEPLNVHALSALTMPVTGPAKIQQTLRSTSNYI